MRHDTPALAARGCRNQRIYYGLVEGSGEKPKRNMETHAGPLLKNGSLRRLLSLCFQASLWKCFLVNVFSAAVFGLKLLGIWASGGLEENGSHAF